MEVVTKLELAIDLQESNAVSGSWQRRNYLVKNLSSWFTTKGSKSM